MIEISDSAEYFDDKRFSGLKCLGFCNPPFKEHYLKEYSDFLQEKFSHCGLYFFTRLFLDSFVRQYYGIWKVIGKETNIKTITSESWKEDRNLFAGVAKIDNSSLYESLLLLKKYPFDSILVFSESDNCIDRIKEWNSISANHYSFKDTILYFVNYGDSPIICVDGYDGVAYYCFKASKFS